MKRLAGLLALLLVAALPARAIDLAVGDGHLEVAMRPDRGRALEWTEEDSHRWVLRGPVEALVGRSYRLELRNRSPYRLKIVVGIDGLNVYHRRPVVGRADGDVGSILAPWGRRELRGWQIDDAVAEEFVFSPPEWSEGQGIRDAEIGRVRVEVYRERLPSPPPRPRRYGGDRDSGRKLESQAPQAESALGTTAGDEIGSSIRRVHFQPRTTYPEAWLELDYGRPRPTWRPEPRCDRLGLRLEEERGGLRVLQVERGSEADRAGLESSDVILRVDTTPRPDPAIFARIVDRKQSGDFLFLRVRRGAHELAFKMRL